MDMCVEPEEETIIVAPHEKKKKSYIVASINLNRAKREAWSCWSVNQYNLLFHAYA